MCVLFKFVYLCLLNLKYPSNENTYLTFKFVEMLERPYYMDYSPMRLVVHKVVTSKYFDLGISAVIGLNVITMAMEFYMMPRVSTVQGFGAGSREQKPGAGRLRNP